MCLIVFSMNEHPDYPLILAANRDEFYHRPTQSADFWEEAPHLLAGKDLQAGGTWMGLSTDGKFAAVTNYRDPSNIDLQAKSRGNLPVDFLRGDLLPYEYLQQLDHQAEAFNGFNLLVMQGQHMYHYSNYERKINKVSSGVHALSNALLDTSWPKTERVKSKFSALLDQEVNPDALLEMMQDTREASEDELPETGIGTKLEKAISPICIRTENYGTCSTSVVLLNKQGRWTFVEQTYAVGDRKAGLKQFEI
jgi:uncharacterized protein with NRDE domain